MEEIVRKAKILYSSHFAQKVNKILLTFLIMQKPANFTSFLQIQE